MNKIRNLYMSMKTRDDEHLSYVDQFLEGRNRFKFMFDREETTALSCGDSSVNCSAGQSNVKLLIPECFHCIKGKEIYADKSCVDKSLLTPKKI